MSKQSKARIGRPPKGAVELSRVFQLRLTPAQLTKLAALGGSEWVRARIERAKGAA